MKPAHFAWLALFLSGLAWAGPVETAIVAAVQLSEAPNYAWSTTVVDDARTYEIEGQTQQGGYTRVKMPMVNSLRRRLGREATDTRIDAIFKGNVRCIFATSQGWKTFDELPPPEPPPTKDPGQPPMTDGSSIPGSRSIAGGIMKGAVIRRVPRPPKIEPDESRAYSNLQLAISHPHEELAVIVSSHRDIRVEDTFVAGTLDERGARLLLVHDGQKELVPLRAAGSFKLWLRNGAMAKYQIDLEGTLAIATRGGTREVTVSQTATTLLKDIGETRFEVPAEAQQKLGL